MLAEREFARRSESVMSRGDPAAGITEFGGCWAGAGGSEPRSDPEVSRVLGGAAERKSFKDPGHIPAAPPLVPRVPIAKPPVCRAAVPPSTPQRWSTRAGAGETPGERPRWGGDAPPPVQS